jgi:hypothetical protein
VRGGKRWIGAGVAVVVVAVVAFVIAQSGGGGNTPLNAIAKAAEVTQHVPGGHAVVKATVTAAGSAEGFTESGSMAFDDHGGAEGTLNVTGNTTGKEVEATVIVEGTKVYTSSEAIDSLPAGKKWMELDYSKAVKGTTASSPAESSPQAGLKILEKVQGVEEVGTEDIEGVATTHYRGTLPVAEEVFGVKTNFSAPETDVWIDPQNRVRRMRLVVTGSLSKGQPNITSEEEITFVDFGRIPKIEAPPQEEVFDATNEIESKVQEAAKAN